jgi:hypothetical protein
MDVGIGFIGEATRGSVRIEFPDRSLSARDDPADAGMGPVAGLLAAVSARGRFRGTADVTWRAGERETWSTDLHFSELALGPDGLLRGAEGSVRLDSALLDPARPEGKGRIVIESVEAAGWGEFEGEAPVEWGPSGFRFKGYLRPRGGSGSPTDQGSVFGSLSWSGSTGLGDADLRWMSLALSSGLLEAIQVSGELRKDASTNAVVGSMRLGPARIPENLLSGFGSGVDFEGGKASFRLVDGSVALDSLRLLGPRQVLRARGSLGLDGALDLAVLLDEGPNRIAVGALSDETGLMEWKRAAGDSFRAFRIRGSLAVPETRVMDPLDPLLYESSGGKSP